MSINSILKCSLKFSLYININMYCFEIRFIVTLKNIKTSILLESSNLTSNFFEFYLIESFQSIYL